MSVKAVSGSDATSSENSESVSAWEEAVNEAKQAGIQWELPDNDKRSAQDVIDDSPLLKNLGNQSGVKDMLEERVGDIDQDADAAYRAAQVLEHVEKFDEEGNRLASNDIGNDRIDGFTSSGEARHGTEAGRLQDFGKYGFSNLQGELNHIETAGKDDKAREDAEALGIQWERPDGDDRSAEDIINDNPLLKDLGNQSDVKDMLKEQVGDFEEDADAAYRAAQVLEHIEAFDEDGKRLASNDVGNGSINGFTSSDEARHGTEAGRLQDFGKYGFSSLKGELVSPDTVGDNKELREQAESVGIQWELPDDDKRSAQDIIDDSPLLKNLGNQSGIKDMLKERVGDFEHDADAAYRASQVLDRLTMYDEEGNSLSGDDVANSSIDGFTSSDEARHGTEAGRLQDFGKYGFEVIQEVTPTEEIGSYQDFLAANPDADDVSKTLAKYTAIIEENYDAIRGKTESGKYLTAEALKQYRDENPQISDDFKEALDFWSKPGAFDLLETSKSPLRQKTDGDLSKNDLTSWLGTHSPKDAGSAITFLTEVINANAVGDIDTDKLSGDLFENPQDYSAEEKAAALQDLLTAQQLITEGAAAGMWKDDYSKVSIANSVRGHPDPEKLLQDVNDHIAILEKDTEVMEYLEESSASQISQLFEDNKTLGEALETTYDEDIKSGEALNLLWDSKMKDGKTDQQAVLAEFFGSAQMFQNALGIDDIGEIQDAVKNSKHNEELETFYEASLASGERLKELLKDNSFEEAASAFSAEVSLYNAALDPDFTEKFDTELNDNFSEIVQENAFQDASFDDLKEVFGVDGGDELDEEKVRDIIDQVKEENPEFFTNPDGTVATSDQIVAGIRGDWDLLRQGTKSLSELALLNPNSGAKAAADAGVLHGVSGLFLAGVTIAKGVNGAGNLTDRQIVDITTGSVMTATLMTEGGMKNLQGYMKGIQGLEIDDLVETISSGMKKFENAAKGLGGIAGVAAGAYAIFDGVEAIRKGDKVGGSISITTGSLAAMAGLASAVEGGLGMFAPSLLQRIPLGVIAGGLGALAAGAAAVALLIPGLIEEGKQQAKADDFGDVLSEYLTKYGVDGVKDGDYWDIPEEDWPGYDDGPTIGS